MRRCARCGHDASELARFCERCGSALPDTAGRATGGPSAGERKQVTVLFCDVVGSMDLTRALEPERYGVVLDRFLADAAGAVQAFGGTVNQFTGDGLMAVFGAPLAHEDHARRACLAVLELRRRTAALATSVMGADGVRFAVRCGLHSGEVVVAAIGEDVRMDFVPLGATTSHAKRIEALAPPGSAAVSAVTAALVGDEFVLRDLGAFALKGVPGPTTVLELVGERPRRAAAAAPAGLSRFVGRTVERAALARALDRVLAGDGHALSIVGEAGIGKSRLARELVAACAERGTPVVAATPGSGSAGVGRSPVPSLLRGLFGIHPRDPPRRARARVEATLPWREPEVAADLPLLLDLLGAADRRRPPPSPVEDERRRRVVALVTRALEVRAGAAAVVVVVDDLRSGDEAGVAFLADLAAATAGTRTLLVTTARPEHEPGWAATRLLLGPLDARAADALLVELLGADGSLDGLRTSIGQRTGGNPFFVEEVVRSLAESGRLSGVRGAHRLEDGAGAVVLPPTVQALLGARIDRLPAREKALVQMMSVIGVAAPAALVARVSELAAVELADAVEVLSRTGWVVPGPEGGHVFGHPLTQEVAYASQARATRARTHRRVAAAIGELHGDALDEHAALLAHHHEGAGDERGAAGWHARAAAWAERAAPADALRHWRRVRELVERQDPSPARDELAARARLGVLDLGWRLGVAPEEDAGLRAEGPAGAGQTHLELVLAGTLMHNAREREGLDGFRRAHRRAVLAGDPGGTLTAATGVAYASWIAGSLREGLEVLDHAIAVAGDDPAIGAGLAFTCPLAQAHKDRALCLAHMGHLDAARAASDRGIALAREHGDPESECAAHASRALFEVELGDVEAALAHARLGLAYAEPAGNVVHALACSAPAAAADARSGRNAAALARATTDLAAARRQRIGLYLEPVLLATIARVRLATGDVAGAHAAAEEAVATMDARGLATCALTAPLALAEVLAAAGGPSADERVRIVLDHARRIAADSGADAYESRLFAGARA